MTANLICATGALCLALTAVSIFVIEVRKL